MFTKLVCLLLATINLAHAGPVIKAASIRAYVTRFEGNLHVGSNVYAIANDETLLLEDHSGKSRMQLKGDELLINFPEIERQISLGQLQNLEQIAEGQRSFVLSNEKVKFRKIKSDTERSLTFIECRADIFCGPTLRINKKIISLFELRTDKGELLCINNGYQKKLPVIYIGKCLIN